MSTTPESDQNAAQLPEMVAPESAKPAGRRTRNIALASIAGVVVLGGATAAAYSAIGGGGPQPEAAFPADTFAFVDVDLDPSAEQKLDALRFIRKFPDAPAEAKNDRADLGKAVFEQLQHSGQLEGLSYETDVKPWLGKRFAMGVTGSGDSVAAIAALAVTDVDKAKAGLGKLAPEDGYCTVGEAFALCGEEKAAVDAAAAAAAKKSLSDHSTFAGDMEELGEAGILSFWADGNKLADMAKSTAAAFGTEVPETTTSKAEGRVVGSLRFDGTALELAALTMGMPKVEATPGETGIGALPAGTMGAIGIANGGDALTKSWAEVEKAGGSSLTSLLGDAESSMGVKLPEDLAAVLGSQFTVAFGGMDETASAPKVAIVSNGDRAKLEELGSKLTEGSGSALSFAGAADRSVLALEDGYADEVASGSGLGSSEVFTQAVPDAGKASFVGFADIARIVEAFGTDMSAKDKANLAPLSGFGLTVTSDGDRQSMTMRVTTR